MSDLILLEARGGYGALCLEAKRESKESRQSISQKEWQKATEMMGNRYVVFRTFEEFKAIVDEYMGMAFTSYGQTMALANSRGVGGVSPFPDGRKPRK